MSGDWVAEVVGDTPRTSVCGVYGSLRKAQRGLCLACGWEPDEIEITHRLDTPEATVNTAMINALRVLWVGGDHRYCIGILRRYEGEFKFSYDALGLVAARSHGFTQLPEFPDETRSYSSPRLFRTFAERVPGLQRKDFIPLLQTLGLDLPPDPFEFFARTGGRLATDRLEFDEPR